MRLRLLRGAMPSCQILRSRTMVTQAATAASRGNIGDGRERAMPASVIVVHDDPAFLDDTVSVLRHAGYDVAGFSQSPAALDALEAAQRVEILVTRVLFPQGTPHGVALARMARLKRPGIKVLFLVRPDLVSHTEGVGDALLLPVTADEVVAKVRAMLGSDDVGSPTG